MLERRLIDYVASATGFGAESIHARTPLFSGGLLDSMSVMDLTLFIEREAGVKIPTGDVSLHNFDSIERIVGYLARRAERP